MKKLFTLIFLLAIAGTSMAQGYTSSMTTGSDLNYNWAETPTTTVIAAANPASDMLSTAQTIPFTFTFFGQSVTQYKASDNGYITFNTSATTSNPTNITIPSASAPTNAIFAFWDALDVSSAGSGTADEVKSWTYGTTPTRVHVIQWHSVTTSGSTPSGQNHLYAAILLHECGDFQVVLPWGVTSNNTATIGAQDANGTTGVMAAGPSQVFPSGLGTANSDDVVYNFFSSSISYDLAATGMNLDDNIIVGNNNLAVDITNYGTQTITSFDLVYTVNGGSNQTASITGQSIAPGASTTVNHTTPINISQGGQTYQICAWAENINSGNSDERTCNDQTCNDLFGINGNSGNKTVLVEEFTGAWCGWCPDGADRLSQLKSQYGSGIEVVSAHLGPVFGGDDDMENQPSRDLRTTFNVTGYPSGMVDRVLYDGETKEPHSRANWSTNVSSQLSQFTPCNVSVTNTFNQSTRQVDATVTVDFTDYANGDLRVLLYVTEDEVTGSGAGYDQVNYLYQNSNYSSSPYYNAGDPIIGYEHPDVLREVFGTINGDATVITSPASPQDQATENYSFTLSSNYDETKVRLVAVVAVYSASVGERWVWNAGGVGLDGVVSVDPTEEIGIHVYPNPATDVAVVKLGFNAAADAQVELMNQYGQVVRNMGTAAYNVGTHEVKFDVQDLAGGVYFVNVKSEGGVFTEKIVVAK